MPLLDALLSQTRKRAITSDLLPAPFDLPPLYNKSRLRGTFTIVKETGNPSAPVAPIDDIIGGSVAITRNGVTLVTATGFTFAANTMSFLLAIEEDIIDTLLNANDDESYINVVMEVRYQTANEEDTILRESLPLYDVDSDIAPAPAPMLTFVDSDSIHWSLVA